MRATSARLSPGRNGRDLLLILYADEGSTVCARLAPELVPSLAEAFAAEDRRLALAASAKAEPEP